MRPAVARLPAQAPAVSRRPPLRAVLAPRRVTEKEEVPCRVNGPAEPVRVARRRTAERQPGKLGGGVDAAAPAGVPGRGVESGRDGG